MLDMDSSWELQKHLFYQLTTNEEVQDEIGSPARVYDRVPDNVVYPFVVIGEAKSIPWNGVDDGVEHDLKIHSYSKYAGRKEVKNVMSAIMGALSNEKIKIGNSELISLRFVFGDVWRKQDREIFQGVMRFRALTHPVLETLS